jgi:hypothetical protein
MCVVPSLAQYTKNPRHGYYQRVFGFTRAFYPRVKSKIKKNKNPTLTITIPDCVLFCFVFKNKNKSNNKVGCLFVFFYFFFNNHIIFLLPNTDTRFKEEVIITWVFLLPISFYLS